MSNEKKFRKETFEKMELRAKNLLCSSFFNDNKTTNEEIEIQNLYFIGLLTYSDAYNQALDFLIRNIPSDAE